MHCWRAADSQDQYCLVANESKELSCVWVIELRERHRFFQAAFMLRFISEMQLSTTVGEERAVKSGNQVWNPAHGASVFCGCFDFLARTQACLLSRLVGTLEILIM